ncbi:hypothetical protein ACHAXA_001753, partial [Cyclostephanos tholiformis]
SPVHLSNNKQTTIMTTTTGGDNAKLARFRELMNAKRLQMNTPMSEPGMPSTTKTNEAHYGKSAATPLSDPGGADRQQQQQRHRRRRYPPSDECARMRPLSSYDDNDNDNSSAGSSVDEDLVVAGEDGIEKMMGEHRTGSSAEENIDPNNNNNNGSNDDRNNNKGGIGNLETMKRIMRRKRNIAQDARRDMESYSSKSNSVDEDRLGSSREANILLEREGVYVKGTSDGCVDDLGGWAMMGNHLEENTTMDREDLSVSFAISAHQLLAGVSSEYVPMSPHEWKGPQRRHQREGGEEESHHRFGGGPGVEEGSCGASSPDMSGLLSFLGDSPAFDRTSCSSEEERGGESRERDEVERNLRRSAEKVRRLEEHLLNSVGAVGTLSPVLPPPTRGGIVYDDRPASMMAGGGRTTRVSAVTFAIEDGWETPRGNGNDAETPYHRRRYPKSPYQFENVDEWGRRTSALNESMEAQANPMNESVIVSDDEASESYLGGEPSPLKGIGSDVDAVGVEGAASYDNRDNDCDHAPESGERSDPGAGSKIESSMGDPRGHDGEYVPKTPSRAALMERNQNLVREVRFADQTCVALAERKKFYKNQVGQYTENLRRANDEISSLRTNYESSIQESARLKVLVESLRAQKHLADAQVEAYRTHIADCEKSHRSSLKKIEKTYYSHLKNAEGQINGLNDRLHESHTANVALQSKLDDLHDKWESKLQSDAASRDLISSLKERVASGNSTASNAHASMEAMQDRVSYLQQLCDQQKSQLQMERSEREMTEQDRDVLQAQCNDLHRQLTEWAQTTDGLHGVFFDEDGSQNEDFVDALRVYTPVKHPRVDNDNDERGGPRTPDRRTPTANLLARTLRSELKRRQTVSEKLEHAERQVAGLKNVVCDMKMECEEAKADNILLVEELEERDAVIAKLELTMGEKDDQIKCLCEKVEVLRRANDGSSSSDEGRSTSRSQGESGIESRSQSKAEDESRSYDAASVLEERLDALEETLNYTDEELKETRARLADTQELLDQTAGELERSEEELAEACDRVADFEAQVDKLFKDLTEKEVEHANLERFCHFQKSTIKTINDKLSKSEKVNVDVRTQLESCFQSLVALDKILRTYEDFDVLAGKTMTEHRHKITHLLETISRALETMKKFSPRASGALTTPCEMGSRVFFEPDLDSPAISSDFHHEQEIKKELDNANIQLKEAQKLLREYRVEFSEKEIERNHEISSLKQQQHQIKTKLDIANEELQNTHKLLQQYQDESSKHEIELNDVNGHLQQANKLLEEYQDELRNQETEHKQETSSLKKQCDELETRLSSVTSDLENCKKENKFLSTTAATAANAVSQQLSVMTSNNTDLMKENESLRISLQSFELQLENEKSLLRATREEADGYRQDVSNAKAAFECMSTECDLTKNTLSKVGKEAHVLRELVNERERELKECRDSLSKAQEALKEQMGCLKSQCLDLEKRLSVEESGRLSAEATLDDAHVHIAMMENIVKEKESEFQEKESECNQLIIQVKEVQNALVEAERERAEADIAIERLENDIQEKKSVVFAYEESIISYKGDIRRLENELQTTILDKDSRIRMLEQACSSRQILFSEQLDRTKKERDLSTAELTDMINRLQNELLESNRLYQESGERAKSTFIDLNKAHQILEQEVVQKNAYIDEVTQKYNFSCEELEKARKEIDSMTERVNSLEMDRTRLATRHQDEVDELLEQRNRIHDEKVQLEEQILRLESNASNIEELKRQQRDEIAQLSGHNISLQKKCDKFKALLKSLNEQNRAWEDSHKTQNNDLMSYGMEIKRLNGQIESMKRVLNSSEHPKSRQIHHQTPQEGKSRLGYPDTV